MNYKIILKLLLICMLFGTFSMGVATASPTVAIDPASTTDLSPGDTFSINVNVDPAGNGVSAGEIQLSFDSSVLNVTSRLKGDILGTDAFDTGSTVDNTAGTVTAVLARLGATTPPTAAGTWVTVTFEVKAGATGTTAIDITSAGLADEAFADITGITTTGGTVAISNNAPVASDQSATTPEDTSVDITLSATDVDGDLLTYSIVDNPSHGTVTLSGNISTYTPESNYNGDDSFTFKANDGTVDSNIATVSITVSAVNNAPVAFGVSDASGVAGSTVSVPLEIANVSNGPIQTIILYMDYNENVISLESVDIGPLTAGWIFELGEDNHSITLTTSDRNGAIPNGSTDAVAYLNFLIVGSPGDICLMTPENIDFSNTVNEHGTATAKIGTFEVLTFGSISGSVSHSNNGTAVSEVIVELIRDNTVIATTTTGLTGEYTFVDLLSGTYELKFSKAHFYDESSGVVEVCAEVNAIVDMSLRLRGDLDNNGVQADAADVNMMMQASVKDITANRYFDLDGNGNYADAVDVNMMLQASVKDIILS